MVDKNLNIEDYKEKTIKKFNLTEQEWNEIVDVANILLKCDNIAIIPPNKD